MTPGDLIDDLRSRINPAYASQVGTESWERRLCVEALEAQADEIERLRAEIEAMKRQEPVAKVQVHKTGGNAGITWSVVPLNHYDSLPALPDGSLLYLAPGAQTVPSAPDGWQPIETAPKDGTHVLLANKTGTRVADGMYGNYKVWSWPYVMVEPAYWRPTPAAPGAQENNDA